MCIDCGMVSTLSLSIDFSVLHLNEYVEVIGSDQS